jgi:Cu-processing system permease protein
VLVLITGAVLLMSVLLWIAIAFNPVAYEQVHPVDTGLAYWSSFAYMTVDLWVVAAFTLLISTQSTTPMLPLLLGIAFAIATHAIGPTADFLRFSPTAEVSQQETLGPVLETALLVLPDMDRLDIRNWTLYGIMPTAAELVWPLCMALSYIGLMLAAAMMWFNRRDFV